MTHPFSLKQNVQLLQSRVHQVANRVSIIYLYYNYITVNHYNDGVQKDKSTHPNTEYYYHQ
jgi:hypothetical protein